MHSGILDRPLLFVPGHRPVAVGLAFAEAVVDSLDYPIPVVVRSRAAEGRSRVGNCEKEAVSKNIVTEKMPWWNPRFWVLDNDVRTGSSTHVGPGC